MMLTLLPPTPRVKPPKMKPSRPGRKPPAPKRQPRVMATPLPPVPHQPVRVAPAASGGGGSPKSRPSFMPEEASHFNKLAVNVADADVSRFLQTFLTDKPEQRHSDKGTAPADSNNKVKAGQGQSPGTTPTTEAGTHGSGQPGTAPGAGGGPGNGPGPGGAGPFGITGKGGGGTGPRHVVYVLDISGSMAMTEAKFNSEKRIDKAREELKAQIQSLSDGELFSIIVFSDEVRTFRQALVSPTKDTVQEAFRFLDKQEPHDATDLERALNMALGMPEVNLIYVITDGVPWPPDGDKYGPKDFPALAERIRKANVSHIPIYTIGLLGPNPYDDGDDSPEASALLTQLAQDSGGKFKDVKLDGEKP